MNKRIPGISIVMPAYNEEKRIIQSIKLVAEWIENIESIKIELVIVDDGSTDKTVEVIIQFMNKYSWINLIEEQHVGMMNAIITGFNNSKYPFVGTLEADSPVHPAYFLSFLKEIEKYDLIVGSRFSGEKVEGKSLFRRFISRVNSTLFKLLFSCPIKDSQISFRLYKKNCIEKIIPILALKHDGFKSSEIVVKAHGLGFRMKEMPVEYNHDDDSKAVPHGIKSISVIFFATIAIFQLWFLSIREYQLGILPYCPVSGKKYLDILFHK